MTPAATRRLHLDTAAASIGSCYRQGRALLVLVYREPSGACVFYDADTLTELTIVAGVRSGTGLVPVRESARTRRAVGSVLAVLHAKARAPRVSRSALADMNDRERMRDAGRGHLAR